MEIKDFIIELADQFDDIDIKDINETTKFQELDDWSSLTAMAIMAMTKKKYGKVLTGREIRSCETVKDLFDLINSK